jgi:D-threonate/D-erythronate kinase
VRGDCPPDLRREARRVDPTAGRPVTGLRLLADDLTGALDTAAAFVGVFGALDVVWDPPDAASGSLVLDTGTREMTAGAARARLAQAAPLLRGADLAFKKVDSLLRGPWPEELAACWGGGFATCILAPAFPHQGRRTHGGRQEALREGAWVPVADIRAALSAAGLDAAPAGADAARGGLHVLDAADEDDLRAVVDLGRSAPGPVLWCGTGGLARALADGRPVRDDPALSGPVLGLFGSDQPATAAQLAACPGHHHRTPAEAPTETARELTRRLARDGAVLVSLDLPPGIGRADAAERIARHFAALVGRLEPPGTVLVAGGETLRALCLGLGARHLRVTGQVGPGLPRSRIVGGAWDGVAVVSKSGAFGPPGLWRDLLAANGLAAPAILDRTDA